MRVRWHHARTAALCAVLLGTAACQPGEIGVVEPDGSDDGPSLGTMEAEVALRPAHASLADSLGWGEGVVPDARVRILRNGTVEWIEVDTDGTGTATIGQLEPGLYYSYVERVLTGAEARNASVRVRGFGDGSLTRVGADTVESSYQLQASKRGDLVISEVSSATPPSWEIPGGGFAAQGNFYFEVYNQSSRAAYLDRRVFGLIPVEAFCHGCANSCEFGEPVRTDSTGVYTRWMMAFPGSGNEYPIDPGEVKLIAGAAHDHRELHEDMLDLRDADFEIGASSFADNPTVPNLINIGPSRLLPLQLQPAMGKFLAEPFDPSQLEQPWRDIRGDPFTRVPVSLITDVTTTKGLRAESDMQHPPCQPIIHPNVDRFPGGFPNISEVNVRSSFQREVLTTEDGIPILMDTNTSASDFGMMRYTPGELPDGGQ